MYYIYHIPEVKIGCSMYPKRRVKKQGYTQFEILEQHIDKNIASNREIQLQIEYGYAVDRIKYNQVDYSTMGHKGGAKNVELGHTKKLQKIGSKIASSLPRSEDQIKAFEKAREIGAPIAWNLPRSEKQKAAILKGQKIGCILGGKIMGAIMKEKLRVPIIVYRKSDNSYVGEYPSVTDCARELDIESADIFHCLSDRQKSTKGYTFKKLQK